jgi:hypothetical protein
VKKPKGANSPVSRSSKIVDRVEEEIRDFEKAQNVRPFRAMIQEPRSELSWTRDLDGYEDAFLSAENAMRRIYSMTEAAKAGFEAGDPESVTLDVFFYQVRAGLIQPNSYKVLEMLEWAQRIGKTQAFLFIQRLASELENARRRVPNAPELNEFRTSIVVNWLHWGFWLMSDDLIARLAQSIPLRRKGCNRQTITKLVRELKLVKHEHAERRPIIKDLGKGGVFSFRKGYLPKS